MGTYTVSPPRPDDKSLAQTLETILRVLERQTRAIERQNRLLDEFAGAHLNAQYPFGKAQDRWRRR